MCCGAAAVSVEPMSSHTTFRIGGPAEHCVCPGNEEELGKVICLCREHGIPWRVLGNGSNLLVSDRGIEGVVIAMKELVPCRGRGKPYTCGGR